MEEEPAPLQTTDELNTTEGRILPVLQMQLRLPARAGKGRPIVRASAAFAVFGSAAYLSTILCTVWLIPYRVPTPGTAQALRICGWGPHARVSSVRR